MIEYLRSFFIFFLFILCFIDTACKTVNCFRIQIQIAQSFVIRPALVSGPRVTLVSADRHVIIRAGRTITYRKIEIPVARVYVTALLFQLMFLTPFGHWCRRAEFRI